MRRLALVLTLLLSFGLAGCGRADPGSAASASASTGPSATSPATASAAIVSTTAVDQRTLDLVVRSPAVGSDVPVRLLLPSRFTSDPSRTWPVLLLLHGCCDSYLSWTRSTDIERLTADRDLLVVMPDGGRVGFYSDWVHGPQWETFHLVELPQLLSEGYRTNRRWAIGGVSMGGLGALGYAARHPGMFSAAASFSGIVHTRSSDDTSQGYIGLVQSEGEDGLALWGDPEADRDVWRDHNPYDLAPRLRGTAIFISAGNGTPGPLDPSGTAPDSIETALGAENRALAERLRRLGLDAKIDLYGDGTHNWVYWERELHRSWPLITRALEVS